MRKLVIACLSLLTGAGLALYSPYSPLIARDAYYRGAIGFLLSFFILRAALPSLTVRRLRFALGIGLCLSASCVLGAELQVYGSIRVQAVQIARNALCWIGLTVFFSSGFFWFLCIRDAWMRKRRKSIFFGKDVPLKVGRVFWLSLGAILTCWLTVWLAYYPGLTNYDILSLMEQCMTGNYSTMHPVLYTLLLDGCMKLAGALRGGTTLGIAFLCLFQVILIAGSMAHAISKLRALGATTLSCLGSLLFFALFPVFPLLAISTVKDAPAAALALIFSVQLLSLFQDTRAFFHTWKPLLGLCVSGVLLGMLRYTGLLALILFGFIYAVFARAKNDSERQFHTKARRCVLLCLISAAAFLGVSGLNAATDAAPSFVTIRDISSLPSQQLVRAVLETVEGEEDFYKIVQWYSGGSMIQNYRPKLADYTKRYINVAHGNGWRGFAETWLQVGMRHPKAYVEAFLELNRGLWFVQDISQANIYPEGYPLSGYLHNDQQNCTEWGDPIMFDSKLPGLQNFLNRLTTENQYRYIPGFRLLFSIGFQCWLTLLLFLAARYRRDRALTTAMGWMLCNIVVLAFAPAVLVRYALPIFIGNGMGLMASGRKL